eukprot:gnl/MRDRNA2_/MRDRNA2_73654_c0_seq1.p1 gnl/MRDRNA2_/MRDRNA2_73654_c0~~gnl/MRDRNA2_/MRDRNA2_73654_c0_seq1.p1  ORF type:complete len:323 (-),score=98.61 gnl/MRDRNA2_/MRDRNA2_73654_c0_seq1:16-984(-)
MDVETFITEHGIDKKAANALRAEEPDIQESVMNDGDMTDVRNKSSVIMGRIRKAKCLKEQRENGAEVVVDPGTLEQFIAASEIDEKAAAELRGEEPVIQQAVMDAGPLTTAKNKSAAMMGRIAKAKRGKRGRLVSGNSAALLPEVRKFIEENDIDERASKILMDQPESVKQAVIDGGSLATAQNKSAALMGRITKAKAEYSGGKDSGKGFSEQDMMMAMMKGAQMSMPKDKSAQNMMMAMMGAMMGKGGMKGGKGKGGVGVEQFLEENGVDDKGKMEFLQEPAWIQQAVIAGGSLKSANNPSAALIMRIRNAKGKGNRSSPY